MELFLGEPGNYWQASCVSKEVNTKVLIEDTVYSGTSNWTVISVFKCDTMAAHPDLMLPTEFIPCISKAGQLQNSHGLAACQPVPQPGKGKLLKKQLSCA